MLPLIGLISLLNEKFVFFFFSKFSDMGFLEGFGYFEKKDIEFKVNILKIHTTFIHCQISDNEKISIGW